MQECNQSNVYGKLSSRWVLNDSVDSYRSSIKLNLQIVAAWISPQFRMELNFQQRASGQRAESLEEIVIFRREGLQSFTHIYTELIGKH